MLDRLLSWIADNSGWAAIIAGVVSGFLGGGMYAAVQRFIAVRYVSARTRLRVVGWTHNGQNAQLRVVNPTATALENCTLYVWVPCNSLMQLTVANDSQTRDEAHNSPAYNNTNIVGARLCWSLSQRDPVEHNPWKIDVAPGEEQSFTLFRIHNDVFVQGLPYDGTMKRLIELPSETGYTGEGGRTRGFFDARQKIVGLLRVVSRNARASEFLILLDATPESVPVSVKRVRWFHKINPLSRVRREYDLLRRMSYSISGEYAAARFNVFGVGRENERL